MKSEIQGLVFPISFTEDSRKQEAKYSMEIYTSSSPKWLQWITPEEFNNEELFRIVIFYVFHSPCPDISAMGKSLEAYNWHNPWSKPYYLNKQLKQAALNFVLVSTKPYDKMSEALEKADLKENFPSDLSRERICIYDNKDNQFMSVFYHIRNSFAHGRLNIVDVNGECTFVLEDVNPLRKNKNNEVSVSARMIIKRSTLLKWIEIIEAGECEYDENK